MIKSIYTILLFAIGITSTRTASAEGLKETVVNMSVTPSLDFGNVIVGQIITRTIVISNASSSMGPLIIWFPSSGPYTAVAANGDPINPGQTKTITVTFRPTAATSFTQSVGIINNSTNLSDPYPVTLTGTGITSNIIMSVSNNSLNFGNVTAGQMPSQQFVVTNNPNSTGPLNISWPPQSPAYSVNPSSAGPLNPGQSQAITVTFNTSVTGSYNQSLNLVNNSSNLARPFPISLNAVRIGSTALVGPNMIVSHNSLDFGGVKGGETKTLSLTISNNTTSSGPLNISWAPLYNTPFQITPSSPVSIAVGQSRSFTITFSPAARGFIEPERTDSFNTTWGIINNASNSSSPNNITVKGTSYK